MDRPRFDSQSCQGLAMWALSLRFIISYVRIMTTLASLCCGKGYLRQNEIIYMKALTEPPTIVTCHSWQQTHCAIEDLPIFQKVWKVSFIFFLPLLPFCLPINLTKQNRWYSASKEPYLLTFQLAMWFVSYLTLLFSELLANPHRGQGKGL